jgi:acetate kinase
MRILVVNAGSSSLKVDVVDEGVRVDSHDALPKTAPRVDAVGHRIVHGGEDFVEPVVVDDDVERRLRDLVDLAPLHQPKSLAGLDAARELLPGVPHVACFDTAFHSTMPIAASTYALPQAWRERWPIRRYGFHGLSHAWATSRVRERHPEARRLVTCHLGAGGSLAAVLDGRCVDTTMGFTPLDGLVMATRSGSVDPGLLLWLEEHEGLSPTDIAYALEHDSGLMGLAGTSDMRELLDRDDAAARDAVEIYLHRLVCCIGAMTASLGGLDCLVFTGGVGENAAAIRDRAGARLAYLGVTIDHRLNTAATPDTDISASGARCRALVVAAREDLQIAGLVEGVLQL